MVYFCPSLAHSAGAAKQKCRESEWTNKMSFTHIIDQFPTIFNHFGSQTRRVLHCRSRSRGTFVQEQEKQRQEAVCDDNTDRRIPNLHTTADQRIWYIRTSMEKKKNYLQMGDGTTFDILFAGRLKRSIVPLFHELFKCRQWQLGSWLL